MQIFYSQPEQTSQMTSLSRGSSKVECNLDPIVVGAGIKNKREWEATNRDVGQSPRKKSKVVEGNKGANDNEGEGDKNALFTENAGSSSRGGGGWPSTATTSP
ncbi:hypothetical protein ACFX2J_015459 [Malus domestica]